MEQYTIDINNGTGTEKVQNGTYNVTSETPGYDDTTLNPKTVTVSSGTTTYNFTVGANGTLTLHVTDDGTIGGTPIVGATFVRTDETGNQYGTEITTDASGNAVFENVPYGAGAPAVYYRQTASAEGYEFNDEVQNETLTTQTETVQIENTVIQTITTNLTDANYTDLPIPSSTLTLEQDE